MTVKLKRNWVSKKNLARKSSLEGEKPKRAASIYCLKQVVNTKRFCCDESLEVRFFVKKKS
jgi:hypothetical protein